MDNTRNGHQYQEAGSSEKENYPDDQSHSEESTQDPRAKSTKPARLESANSSDQCCDSADCRCRKSRYLDRPVRVHPTSLWLCVGLSGANPSCHGRRTLIARCSSRGHG